MIYLTNQSTVVSDDDVLVMAQACSQQLRLHASPLWGKLPVPVVFVPKTAVPAAAPGAWVLAVLDDSDQADALGWHTEDQGDVVYGRVFAKPVLDNGGNALTHALSVCSVASHEVLETFVDPNCNLYADAGNGVAYAVEVCDPVESDAYVLPVVNKAGVTVRATVSNFVTPHWFDPQAGSHERLDMMARTPGPFRMTKGGYVITMAEGRVTQSFGEEFPAWRRATKEVDTSRMARRSR